MRRYKIADLLVDMDVSGRTAQQAEAYLFSADGPADITLSCDVRRILELCPELGSEELAQYLGTGQTFARELLKFDGVYLHSSAISLDGRAYLFSAPSGTGKSTHTEKWCRLFGAAYLNDDKPVLRKADGVWTAYGTPWSGKNDLSSPQGVPLGGIAFLRRGEVNAIRRITPAEALPRFMSQSLWRLGKEETMCKQLLLVEQILREVPIWELTCRNDDDAAMVSSRAMTGNQSR